MNTVLLLWAALVSSSVDLSSLSAPQRQIFDQVASSEYCNCTSALTIATCLETKPRCRIASRLGDLIKRGAKAGVPADELYALVSREVMGPFCGTQKVIDLSIAPSEGDSKAPITVVEFADFRCPHCQQAAPMVHQSIKRFGNKIHFVFVPFPLQNHPHSLAAAEAILAAHAQKKFRVMHDLMMHKTDGIFDTASLMSLAQKAGLHTKRFSEDLKTGKYKDSIRKLKEMALALGLEGTPAVFINGRPYKMDSTLLSLDDRLQMEFYRTDEDCR
jgi:protein-disulfide isomerase